MILRIRSRHPSIVPLRGNLKVPVRAIWRHGSTTPSDFKYEINSVQGIKNSANKLLMKKKFEEAKVNTAQWLAGGEIEDKINSFKILSEEWKSPIVAKSLFGSRGEGNYLLNTKEELEGWLKGKNLNNYIFEAFYTYSREYRFHVTDQGCFYACRKLLKEGSEKRWARNSENVVWITEENPLFDNPINVDKIIDDCKKALKALDLDIAAFDVKMQTSKNDKGEVRPDPKFIILESNSAPSLAAIGLQKYRDELPRLLKHKYKL